jgi:hypothetical protein
MSEQVPLGIVDAAVPRGSHVCTFFSGSAQRDDVVVPFLAEGIRSGNKCVAVLEAPGPQDLLTRLGGQVDLGRSVETGQLELPAPADAYLRSGQFSIEDMLDYWRDVATAAQGAARFSFIRATGEMPSVLDHPDGRAEFFATSPCSRRPSPHSRKWSYASTTWSASARRYSWTPCGPIPGSSSTA